MGYELLINNVFVLKLTKSVKFLTTAMTVVALTNLSSIASENARFFVECHAFVTDEGNISRDYAYHLTAWGYPEEVANGININLDQKNVVLWVDSKQSNQKEYRALYPRLIMVMRQEQPCQEIKCQQVEYEPKHFEGKLVVTYDKDRGVILIKHAIAKRMPGGLLAPETSVQARGGCQFVVLPSSH